MVADGTIGWGIAGCGWVARDYVAPAIAESRNGRLVASYDRDSDAMRALGGTPCATLAAFLGVPGLDAVYVATPNDSHRELVEAAAGASLAVFCEKPMATRLADAEAMVRACARAGVPYATAFDQRFHAAHAGIADAVARGAVGRVTVIRIVYACWLDNGWSADNWRVDRRRAGGGALFDLAPHGLDLASMLLGEELDDIAAFGQRRVHDYDVEDGALVIARTASGALVQMHVAYNCPERIPRRRLEVLGTAGQIVALDTMGQTAGGLVTLTDAATGSTRPLPCADIDRSPFTRQVEAFAETVLGRAPFPFTPAHDLHVMRLLAKAQAMATASHTTAMEAV